MGVAAAAGSFGQFLMVPVEGWLISQLGWQTALLVLAASALLIVPLALGLREPAATQAGPVHREQTISQALREAFQYRSFQLLMAGYFRLRLSGGVHWRAHAQLPEGPRPGPAGRQLPPWR
jgi:nitrate/nitrite transporter NarK